MIKNAQSSKDEMKSMR